MEQVIKRGRGRPRKTEIVVPQVAEQPKRGRGRPRKTEAVAVLPQVEQPKRGRGRPRKTGSVAPATVVKKKAVKPTYSLTIVPEKGVKKGEKIEKELSDIISASIRPIVKFVMKRGFEIW